MQYECKNLSYQYGSSDATIVFQNVDLSIAKNDFFVLQGNSGCGKSTLLYLLNRTLRPTRGTILYDGRNLGEMTDAQLSALRRDEVGFCLQEPRFVSSLNVLENIEFALAEMERSKVAERIQTDLSFFGLEELQKKKIYELSGGEKRKIMLIISALKAGKVWILDEPTNDLDEQSIEVLCRYINRKYRDGCTIVLSTHRNDLELDGAEYFLLEDGKLDRK